MWPGELPQLSVRLHDLPSTFCACVGHSVKFWWVRRTIRQLPSPFHASTGASVNFLYGSSTFSQLPSTFVHLQDLTSIFRASTGHSVIFHQNFLVTAGPSINFPSGRRTFHQLLSAFHLSGHSITILCGHGTFCQLSKQPRDFCKLPSTCLAARRPPVNICESKGPSVNFCQLSSSPRDFPPTSVKFPWVHGIFRQHSLYPLDLPSTFHACAGPSIDFSQL